MEELFQTMQASNVDTKCIALIFLVKKVEQGLMKLYKSVERSLLLMTQVQKVFTRQFFQDVTSVLSNKSTKLC